MTTTLVLPTPVADELRAAACVEVETAGVVLARPVPTPSGDLRLLAQELHWVPEDAYVRRDPQEMTIRSDGYVHALAIAELRDCVPIWLHTHPGADASPRPSDHDEAVDEQLKDVFRIRSGSRYYGSMVVSTVAEQLRFTGHLESDGDAQSIDRLWTVGPRLALTPNTLHQAPAIPAQFDRNVRALGGAVQHVLGDLHIAVVGSGGTGSAVAEQLVRLGVRRITIVDPDSLTASNLTRVYGSFATDVGSPKVDVLANHLRRIAPTLEVDAKQATITDEGTARLLLDADVVFGCTDDNAGRLVLSRLTSYLLTPVIDCGVLLSSDPAGRLIGIDGRVTVLTPGTACLVCRGRVDLRRAAAQLMASDERQRLVDEGYAPALPGVEPAVVTFTTQVAAAAVGELLERLVHYGVEPPPSEVLLRLHEREISTNDQQPRAGHYCDGSSERLGAGLTDPFLEQTWPA